MPSLVPTTSEKTTSSAATIRSHARVNGPLHLSQRNLPQVAPAAGILKKEMPFLQRALLRAGPGPAVPGVGLVLAGPGRAFGHRVARPEIVPGREHRPGPAQDHHPHLVVGLGRQHRVTEFDQQASVLRVPGGRAVQHDARDRSLVQQFVRQVLVGGHAFLLVARVRSAGALAARRRACRRAPCLAGRRRPLANGLRPGFGRLRVAFDVVVRSLVVYS
jgi:hypothetical protein